MFENIHPPAARIEAESAPMACVVGNGLQQYPVNALSQRNASTATAAKKKGAKWEHCLGGRN